MSRATAVTKGEAIMVLRKFLFCASASLILATTAATPGWAQYAGKSTPEERAETGALNRDAVNGRIVRPTAEEQSQYESARADYEAAEARYREQLEEYNERSREYDAERGNYGEVADAPDNRQDNFTDRNDAYGPDAGDDSSTETDDVATGDSSRPDDLWTLDRFSDPNDQLYNAPVIDIDGFNVGHFRRIETRESGERMVVITLNSLRTISLPIEDIFYDPAISVVVAQLTNYEIDRTPSG
jgi:hypothetical protein